MTDQSPEPRDPWAPPERPAGEFGGPQGAHGVPGPPSVHDQPTIAGMPGADIPPAAAPQPSPGPQPGVAPQPGAAPQQPAPQQPAPTPLPPAYGYPAQPAPPAYAYPGPAPVPAPAPPAYGYPGYPGYGAYPYGAQPRNGFGVTALVLGIIAVVGCFTSFLAVALGIAAVVFGVLGRGKARRGEATNGGMALAGIILGAIGIVLGAALLVIGIIGILDRDGDFRHDTPHSDTRMRERV
ncbi:DUF4190 domain-containing protein [Streptomyces sp. NPDC046876]|uniref:DUF4190 domain-containing protein n=1 Tax=Streptomyces sp. NPDC046876 TaxID=3155616 RepID=UPI0033C72221